MTLDLSNKGLTTLDGIDLTGVTQLYCGDNQLTSLPPLPKTLKELYCCDNNLTRLPNLPETLKKLYCQNNQLTSLPPLPETLQQLYCEDNQLMSLPPLPETLEELDCYNNLLTFLPSLPKTLKFLYCHNNQLTSLPDLPHMLIRMQWDKLDWDITIEIIKLNQHNKKRIDLGMDLVKKFPDEKTWDEINEMWVHWQYRIGGAKYNEVVSAIN